MPTSSEMVYCPELSTNERDPGVNELQRAKMNLKMERGSNDSSLKLAFE